MNDPPTDSSLIIWRHRNCAGDVKVRAGVVVAGSRRFRRAGAGVLLFRPEALVEKSDDSLLTAARAVRK